MRRVKVEALSLRVNGLEYPTVDLQLKIEDGYPGGDHEIVIHDPILGSFAVSRECLIEIREGEGPWKIVTEAEAIHAIRKVTP